jgi:DNA-binding NarL/FixJ family response regulator
MPTRRPRRDPFGFPKKPSNVTHRDIELLRLIADGLAGKQIAERMGLSVKGVEYNKSKLYKKIGVINAVGATRYAIVNGYVKV